MNRDQILIGVIECISESLVRDKSEMNLKTKIIADLGADSLDFMDIIFHLDSKFNINLQKEDFDLMIRLGVPREQAVSKEFLTDWAKGRLKTWLPSLETEKNLQPKDLAPYVTCESIVIIVEEHLFKKEKPQQQNIAPTVSI